MAQKLLLTRTSRAVIAALARNPGGEMWGRQICADTELPPGTVYPLLSRLADLGWVASRHENETDTPLNTGPLRRFWRLTDDGRNHAAAVLASTEKRPVLESLNGDRT